MGWTKQQFVDQAFSKIGLAAYVYDLTPDQRQNALRQMDSMLATWNAKGIRIGYPLPADPSQSDLTQQTGVPDRANEAIYLNLGLRIAPDFGKTCSPEHKASAKDAFDTLLLAATFPPEMQLPEGVPLGAGNRRFDQPFTGSPDNPLMAGNDSAIEFD